MSESRNHDAAEAKRPTDERDERGRFVAGNKGGPGNPFARRTAQLRKAMLAAVSDDDVQAIILKVIELARGGDVAAAKLVLAYAVGRPTDPVDPDTVDVHEFQLYQKATAGAEAMGQVMERLPVETACALVRAVRPVLAEAKRRDLLERFENAEEELDDEDDQSAEEPQSGADDETVRETLRQQAADWAEKQDGLEQPSANGANGRPTGSRQSAVKPRRKQRVAPSSANGANGGIVIDGVPGKQPA